MTSTSRLLGRAPDPAGAVHPRRRPRRTSITVVCLGAAAAGLLLALAIGGGDPQPPVAGLPDAGLLTGWALPLLRLLMDLAAVGTVGLLLTGSVLMPGDGLVPVRAAAGWAAGWALATLLGSALTLSDVLGQPLLRVPWRAALTDTAWTLPQTRALAVTFLVAGAVAVTASRRPASTRARARWLLLAALVGLLPSLLVGHSAGSVDHYQATTGLVLHVLAASLWVGGLLGLVRARRLPVTAVRRFSSLALVCFLVVAGSGLLTAWTRLGPLTSGWTSPYARVVLAKALLLLVLGGLGWWHRRRLLSAWHADRFRRLAAGEVLVMATSVGLAAGLSRTPLPPTAGVATHGLGHSTSPADLDPVTAWQLVSAWTVDPLVLVAVASGLALYLAGVRRAHATGHGWPAARTVAALGAAATSVLALTGGVAVYSTALVSVHIAQLLLLLLVVPALVTLAAPLGLWAAHSDHRARAVPGRWAAALDAPANGMVAIVLLVLALYTTPLLTVALRSPGAHLLASVLALVAGLLWLHPLLAPSSRPLRERLVWLLCGLAFLATIGLQLASPEGLLGGTWFGALDLRWVDLVTDQRRGAAVVAGFLATATPLLLLAAARTSRLSTAPLAEACSPIRPGVRNGV